MQESDDKVPGPDAEEPAAEPAEEPTGEEPIATSADQPAEEPVAHETEPKPEAPAEKQPTIAAPDAALVEGAGAGLTWIPFAVYLGLWVALSGLSAYLLSGATPEQPARWLPQYVPLLWSGVGLTVLGPVLSLAVWLIARASRAKQERRGLFASAMTRGALVTFFGFALWVGTLFVLDLVSTGRTL